jgi:hypothetical protein
MTWREKKFNAWKEHFISVHKDQSFRTLKFGKISISRWVRESQEGRFFGDWIFNPEIELLLLNVKRSIGKEFYPADVIEIYMGDHYPFHFGSINSEPCQYLNRVDIARNLLLLCKRRSYTAIHNQSFTIPSDHPNIVIAFNLFLPLRIPQDHGYRADERTCIFDCVDLINR